MALEPTQRLPDYARDNETAEKRIAKIRWPARPRCPYCDSDKAQYPTAHKTMTHRCRSKGCHKSFSVKTGTVMQWSKVTYQQWAIAILFLTDPKGVSSMKLHYELKLTQKTAWHLAHRLREAWALESNSMTSSRTRGGWVPKKKTPIIELARQDYQPTKAEREEKVALRHADGSAPGRAEVMRALTRPVEITYLEKPGTMDYLYSNHQSLRQLSAADSMPFMTPSDARPSANTAVQEDQNMRVIAIDPAPGRPSTIFDGEEHEGELFPARTGDELRLYLDEPHNRTRETLLCWDAPLTGPADPAAAGIHRRDFTQRPIESFFRQAAWGFPTPKGISVRSYSGCPHWTMTRSLLGLPRTGPYDHEFQQLPFHLLPAPQADADHRPSVVEIHPAVAVWLWCRNNHNGAWNYKQNAGVRNALWNIVLGTTRFVWDNRCPDTHDEFDAAVGYILGSIYLHDRGGPNPRVEILGCRSTGSFLLPADSELKESWHRFLDD